MENLIKTDQLEEVVKQSGLDIKEGEEIKQSYLPFIVQLSEIHEQSAKINFETPTRLDEEIAAKLRKATVKIRTGASDLKDSRKRIHLLKGNLEQAAYNLIAASCKLTEETFTAVEKAREIAEAKRVAELRVIRDAEAEPFKEFIPSMLDLGRMDEDEYQKLLSGAKMQLQAKKDAEIKAEQERLRIEQERAAEEKRIRDENDRLRKENEAREKQLAEERAKADRERLEAEAKAKKEREAIQAKAEAERKAAEEKARLEREESERKLAEEREIARKAAEKAAAEKAKLEAELKDKTDAEEKARLEAEQKAAAEQKARELAEKKAKAAPDKTKLMNFADMLNGLALPECGTIEAIHICDNVKILIAKTTAYINESAAKL